MKLLQPIIFASALATKIYAETCQDRINSGEFSITVESTDDGVDSYEDTTDNYYAGPAGPPGTGYHNNADDGSGADGSDDFYTYHDSQAILDDYDNTNSKTNMKARAKSIKRLPKNTLTKPRVIFIVDSTGSMKNVVNEVVTGINDMVTTIRASNTKTRANRNRFREALVPAITYVRFAQKLNIESEDNIHDFSLITNNEFVPKGQTALYDAIGCTLQAYENEEANVVRIITDGEDNMSRIFNIEEIKDMVDRLTNEKFWNFEYMGAEHAVRQASVRMGIGRSRKFAKTIRGTKSAFNSLTGNVQDALKAQRKIHRQKNVKKMRKVLGRKPAGPQRGSKWSSAKPDWMK